MVVKTDGPEKPRTFKLITLRQLVHCTCRPNLAMNMEKENVTDRELFSELFENPIQPLQIHIVPPFVDGNSPSFHLQIHGEEVYRCRENVGSRRQCSIYFNWVSSRLVTSSRSLLEIVLGTQSRKAFGDFGERSKPQRTEKGEKNRTHWDLD